MEKEPKIIRHLYLNAQPHNNSEDRKRMTMQLPLYEAFLRSLGYTPEKARALLTKQRQEVNIHNARIIAKRNKEKQRIYERRRKVVAEIFFESFNIEYLDENDVWLPTKIDEQIVHEHKDKLGEVDYTIKTTPRKLIEISLLKAITSLKGDDEEVREQMHQKYDTYEMNQWYPLDGSKPMRMFKLRLKWKF